MSYESTVSYLRSLRSVRERCHAVLSLCRQGLTHHFSYNEAKLDHVVDYVINTMNENFPRGPSTVPFHSRWRHFEPQGVDRAQNLKNEWKRQGVDEREICRRSLDLAVVSVLLDAGAGKEWKFHEQETAQVHARSEGLGVASFHMFKSGFFSSDPEKHSHQADAQGLRNLAVEDFRKAFQIDDVTNPLIGAQERTGLLNNLGASLEAHAEFFRSKEDGSIRPGNMVDYLYDKSDSDNCVSIEELWRVVIEGFEETWPKTRTQLQGKSLGDAWPCDSLPTADFFLSFTSASERTFAGTHIVCFHKLSQWLTYSLIEPMQDNGLKFSSLHLMTGLAEYRNGGLIVDLGLITPKSETAFSDTHNIDSGFVVEWRALTVSLLDEIADRVRAKLNLSAEEFPLVKLLEGGTWKAGRKIAKELRDGSQPFNLKSDGTVF